jgi:phosphoribosylpyrophosphate synthetase
LSGSALENLQKSKITKLYISDTVVEEVDHPKIEVVTCSELLAKAIEFLISNKSLSVI